MSTVHPRGSTWPGPPRRAHLHYLESWLLPSLAYAPLPYQSQPQNAINTTIWTSANTHRALPGGRSGRPLPTSKSAAAELADVDELLTPSATGLLT